MASIRFVDAEDEPFLSLDRLVADGILPEVPDEQLEADPVRPELRVVHPEASGMPQLMEVRYPPRAQVSPHGHETAEIMVMLAGEIIFGRRHLGPGSSVRIPPLTLYSFRCGPDGATIYLFRPAGPARVVLPEELRGLRRATRST
jgi:hypothetical protein